MEKYYDDDYPSHTPETFSNKCTEIIHSALNEPNYLNCLIFKECLFFVQYHLKKYIQKIFENWWTKSVRIASCYSYSYIQRHRLCVFPEKHNVWWREDDRWGCIAYFSPTAHRLKWYEPDSELQIDVLVLLEVLENHKKFTSISAATGTIKKYRNWLYGHLEEPTVETFQFKHALKQCLDFVELLQKLQNNTRKSTTSIETTMTSNTPKHNVQFSAQQELQSFKRQLDDVPEDIYPSHVLQFAVTALFFKSELSDPLCDTKEFHQLLCTIRDIIERKPDDSTLKSRGYSDEALSDIITYTECFRAVYLKHSSSSETTKPALSGSDVVCSPPPRSSHVKNSSTPNGSDGISLSVHSAEMEGSKKRRE